MTPTKAKFQVGHSVTVPEIRNDHSKGDTTMCCLELFKMYCTENDHSTSNSIKYENS